MEIDSVLAQIRSLSSQTRIGTSQASPVQQSGPSAFASILSKGIDDVNQTQLRAGQATEAFERGTPGVELPQVMIEMQKASVSFRALTEVRNRLVSAYQEIMNMQV
jgi:flagellar hook-basal body complex protein FliE